MEVSGRKESERFNEVLIEAIDSGLESIGRTGRALIYQVLESKYHVKQNEIPSKLEDFFKCLDYLFGAGGRILQEIIVKNLYRKLELDFPKDDNRTLIAHVNSLKNGSRVV